MFNDDGGFFAGAAGYGAESPYTPKAGGGKGNGNKADSLLPVTTRQIRCAGELGVRIAGADFHLVTLVGRVIGIETTSLNVIYTIEDDRGTVKGIQWVELDVDGSGPTVVVNTMCRVYGSVKSQDDEKYIMVFKIKPIESLNEITTHRLEVAVFAKKIELSCSNSTGGMDTTGDVGYNVGPPLGNSLMDMGTGYNRNTTSMSNVQRQVFQVIKRFQDPGASVQDINNYLIEKLPQAQIAKICDDLMNEGHIYSSVDENHFLCTEI